MHTLYRMLRSGKLISPSRTDVNRSSRFDADQSDQQYLQITLRLRQCLPSIEQPADSNLEA